MRRFCFPVLAVALLVAGPARLHAQRDARVLTRPPSASRSTPGVDEIAVRTVSGAALGLVGAFGGGYIGYHTIPRRFGGDDPGLYEAVMGAMAGAALGAAVGAAVPRLGNSCNGESRFGRALLATTAVMGLAMLSASSGRSGVLVLGLVGATPIAAAAAVSLCGGAP